MSCVSAWRISKSKDLEVHTKIDGNFSPEECERHYS